MNILFIHQNFPGQFLHLSAHLAGRKRHRVVALAMQGQAAPAGVELRRYGLLRAAAPAGHPLLHEQEAHVLRAEACAAAALQLKRDGFTPDLVVAHPGWGEALFIKDVFPQARLVLYCEYYYALEGQDVGFDPQQPPLTFQQRCRLRLKNSTNLLSMELADAALSPTHWQRNTYPAWARDKISVIHDGIDAARLRFDPAARLELDTAAGRVRLRPGDEVLSYVARNLEPARGYPVFMRALAELLRRRPRARAVLLGGDEAGYGQAAPDGRSWKQHMLAELEGSLDLSRVHFLGQVSYQHYLRLLSISRVHAYWTTPFVLSWSFLEAAISGLPVVASDTPPVREFADRLGVATLPYHAQDRFAEALAERLAGAAPRRADVAAPPELDLARCLRAQSKLLARL
jgi:glycosyltransferase involved in cell wall biosynthesis